MTETKATSRTSNSRRKGLHIERFFSTEGTHPYDEVTWERRDVVQTNWRTNEVVFEQRGVEFPDFWSANAATIVTNKYFRGALGTVQRGQPQGAHRPCRRGLREHRQEERLLRHRCRCHGLR